MEFTLVTAKSPEKLVDALNAEEKEVSIKTLCGMMWQPHGAVVIIGYEPRPAPKKRPRCNLVQELELVTGGTGGQGAADVHADSSRDSGSTKTT